MRPTRSMPHSPRPAPVLSFAVRHSRTRPLSPCRWRAGGRSSPSAARTTRSCWRTTVFGHLIGDTEAPVAGSTRKRGRLCDGLVEIARAGCAPRHHPAAARDAAGGAGGAWHSALGIAGADGRDLRPYGRERQCGGGARKPSPRDACQARSCTRGARSRRDRRRRATELSPLARRPVTLRLDDFVACLEERQVLVLPSSHFAVAEGPAHPRIRVCLGGNGLDALRPGLAAIAQLLQEPSRTRGVFV